MTKFLDRLERFIVTGMSSGPSRFDMEDAERRDQDANEKRIKLIKAEKAEEEAKEQAKRRRLTGQIEQRFVENYAHILEEIREAETEFSFTNAQVAVMAYGRTVEGSRAQTWMLTDEYERYQSLTRELSKGMSDKLLEDFRGM
jgi:translation initiation factor 2B subunit (eIF-2B alpha/beta/delta family)